MRARAALLALALLLPILPATATAVDGPAQFTGDRDGDPAAYTEADVLICVVDTGVDAGHADLAGKVLHWKDFVNGRDAPYDDHGHGTLVAGVAAGTGTASDGKHAGIAPGAAIAAAKVLAADGSGSFAAVAQAIKWCAGVGADVINLSLGSTQCGTGASEASRTVNEVAASGVPVVVAAGNSGPWPCTVGEPGAAEGALTVGAMGLAGNATPYLVEFSSRGPTKDGRIKPDVVAPGLLVVAPRAGTRDGYRAASGTSLAAPHVAGALALALDANANLSGKELKALAKSTAEDWGPPGLDNHYGAGRLMVKALLQAACECTVERTWANAVHHAYRHRNLRALEEAHVWRIRVDDASIPIVAVLFTQSGIPAEVQLTDGDGNVLAAEWDFSPQRTIGARVPAPGDYYLRVETVSGFGGYGLEASGGFDKLHPHERVCIINPEFAGRMCVTE